MEGIGRQFIRYARRWRLRRGKGAAVMIGQAGGRAWRSGRERKDAASRGVDWLEGAEGAEGAEERKRRKRRKTLEGWSAGRRQAGTRACRPAAFTVILPLPRRRQ